jgi:hypothetical protein
VVTPPEKNANLSGAKVVSVGQLCPLRLVNHVFMTVDSAAFALALDALNNNGVASVTRLLPKIPSVCTRIQAENMDVSQAFDLEALFKNLIDGFM